MSASATRLTRSTRVTRRRGAALYVIVLSVAMIVAVRQALDYPSTRSAIAVCLLGWVLAIAIAVVLGVLFGPTLS